MKRKECESRIVPTAKYITVLDFEVGRVFQYKISADQIDNVCDEHFKEWNPDSESCEEFITNKGHRLNNCEWMVHDSNEIITN